MVKKKKFFNEQKIILYYTILNVLKYKKLIRLSLSKNFEFNGTRRCFYTFQKQYQWFKYIKTRNRLRCFYSFKKSVPANNLQLSRHVLNTDKLSYYLTNYVKYVKTKLFSNKLF